MSKSVIIVGASGHGKVIADIVINAGDDVKGFLDDSLDIRKDSLNFPLLGDTDQYFKYKECYFIIGIGNSVVREKIVEKLEGVKWYTAIHPKAVISTLDTHIGEGTAIMAGAVINPGASIGKHCIINTTAVVEHDNQIKDYVHVSVGAKLAGTVSIGQHTWVGIGAVVSNNITVCENCMIGAGAVVVKNIQKPGIYVGVPAKRVDK